MMPTKGFDEFAKRIGELRDQTSEKLGGDHSVPLTDLFNDDFMAQHTKFQTWRQMLETSGVQSPEEIVGDAFSEFVASNSDFASWAEMHKAAGAEWVLRKFNG